MDRAENPPAPARGRLSIPDVRRRLLEHYDGHRRDLPWRAEREPYRVWVSEVMLQQTRVETVVGYYQRWLERFPDVDALADADEDDVLELWEGLGYYARALNLRRAARLVRDRHQGVVPRKVEQLRRLPGVGPYTAAAVASIAFGVATPAVDGNARRVLCRLFDLRAPSAGELEKRGARLVDPGRPGDFNEALMDLGATVCTPRRPRCHECPLGSLCRARSRGTVPERPLRARRSQPPERTFVVAVIVDTRGRVLLGRRPRAGLLGGLWAFPEAELGRRAPLRVAKRIAEALGVPIDRCGPALRPVAHAFSHLRARYLPVLLRTAGGEDGEGGESSGRVAARGGADRRWIDPAAPRGIALPSAQRRIMAAAASALRSIGASAAHPGAYLATPTRG